MYIVHFDPCTTGISSKQGPPKPLYNRVPPPDIFINFDIKMLLFHDCIDFQRFFMFWAKQKRKTSQAMIKYKQNTCTRGRGPPPRGKQIVYNGGGGHPQIAQKNVPQSIVQQGYPPGTFLIGGWCMMTPRCWKRAGLHDTTSQRLRNYVSSSRVFFPPQPLYRTLKGHNARVR